MDKHFEKVLKKIRRGADFNKTPTPEEYNVVKKQINMDRSYCIGLKEASRISLNLKKTWEKDGQVDVNTILYAHVNILNHLISYLIEKENWENKYR